MPLNASHPQQAAPACSTDEKGRQAATGGACSSQATCNGLILSAAHTGVKSGSSSFWRGQPPKPQRVLAVC